MARKSAYSVLLVDDCDDDRVVTRLAFSKHPKFALVGEVSDGESAIAWLDGQGKFSNRKEFPFPDLMVLDIMMPRMSGHEVLEWVKSKGFPDLRVVMLSGSLLPADANRSKSLGAAAHYQKDVFGAPQHAMLADLLSLMEQ